MKAFLWSLCLHIVLIGLLTYHHFAPTDAAKVKPKPPILAYAYQPIKAVKAAPVQPQQEVTKAEQVIVPPMPVKKPNQQAPAKTPVKKPQKKNTSQKAKPAKAKVAPPKKKPFVPVRKPAMVKTPPVVPAPKPLPAPKVAEVVAAKPLPAPKAAEVVAAKPLPAPKAAEVVAAKPLPAPKAAEVVAAKPLPAAKVAKPVPEAAKAKVTNPAAAQQIVQRERQNGPLQSARKQDSADQLSGLLQKDKSMANKALQSAKQGDASGSGSWKEQQKQLALEITAQKAEPKPETGRKVKDFADGSMLIDTNPGCWKVPPAGSSKGSIWLSTSVPCKADTTVEQIDAILNKRRSYSRD